MHLTGLVLDEALARYTRTVATSAERSNVYLSDLLGSVIAQVRADQSVQSRAVYSPYGEASASGDVDGNAIGYTGREDDGTGLYFYRARYYDSVLNRFVSSDPIGLEGGINRYAYVDGDPLRYADPEGLIPLPWWAIGWGVANGLMSGYQRWLDPCASWGQIARDFAGGFASGFLSGLMPITSMRAGQAILAGAAAGYGGANLSSLISTGSMASSGAATQSMLLGGLGGAVGNVSGLGAALANVRFGLTTTKALRTGDRLGTGAGVGVSAVDAASQFSPPQGREDCICRR